MVWMLRHTELSLGVFGGDILKGFVLCRQIQEGHLRIEFLGVNPTVQKEGIGTMLLKHVLLTVDSTVNRLRSSPPLGGEDILQFAAEFKEITLIPVEDLRIIKWYQKYGFSLTGETHWNPFTQKEEDIMKLRNQHPS